MLNLDKVTLVAVYSPWNKDEIKKEDLQDGEKEKTLDDGVEKTIKAIHTCLNFSKFKSVKFITSKEVVLKYKDELLSDGILCEESSIPIKNMKDYSRFMIYNLNEHVHSDFALTIQHDGFIINPNAWRDDFLDYDYIGAPWPWREQGFVTPFGEHISVGNGGFSLRSKKLLELPTKVEVPFDVVAMNDFYKMFGAINWNEDGNICVHNRHIFEQNGCRFAPVEIAKYFSYESPLPINQGIIPFGYHGNLPPTVQLV
jgi:hypothetical protein